MEFLKRLLGRGPAQPTEAGAPDAVREISETTRETVAGKIAPRGAGSSAVRHPSDDDSSIVLNHGHVGHGGRRKRQVPAEGGDDGDGGVFPAAASAFETPAPAQWHPLERFWWIRRQFGLVTGSRQGAYVEESFRQGGDDVALFLVGASATVSRLLYEKTLKGWALACALEIPARTTGLHAPMHVLRFTKGEKGAAQDVLVARLARKPGEERPFRGKDGPEWPDVPPLTRSVEKRLRPFLSAVPGEEAAPAPETARVQAAIPDGDELKTPDVTRIPPDAFDFFHLDYLHYDPRLAHFRNVIQEGPHVRLGSVCEISFDDEEWPQDQSATISHKSDPFRKMHFDLSRLPTLGVKCLYLRSKDPKAFPREYLAMFAGTWFFTAHCTERALSRTPDAGLSLEDLQNVLVPVPTKLAKRVARRYWKLRGKSEMFQHLELGSFRERALRADPMAVHAEDFLLAARRMPDPHTIFRSRDLLVEFENAMGEAWRGLVGENYVSSGSMLGRALEALLTDWLMELNGESLNVYLWPNPQRWGDDGYGMPTLRKYVAELRAKGFGEIFENAEFVRALRNRIHPALAARERSEKERLEKERLDEASGAYATAGQEDRFPEDDPTSVTKDEIERAIAATMAVLDVAYARRTWAQGNEESEGVGRYAPPPVDEITVEPGAAALLRQLRVRTPPPDGYDGSSATPYRGHPIQP